MPLASALQDPGYRAENMPPQGRRSPPRTAFPSLRPALDGALAAATGAWLIEEEIMPLRQKVVEDLAEVFGVLSHPTRVRILALLHLGEHDVTELREHLGLSAANVSQHLALLRARHLVKMRREGTRVYYSLGDPRVAELINNALDILDEDMSLTGEIRQAIQQVRLQS
jgi:DNA-binding transcriptional ArsR family regulator